MNNRFSKGQVGRVRDALAESGITAPVRHVEVGTGFYVDTSGLTDARRQEVRALLQRLDIEVSRQEQEA